VESAGNPTVSGRLAENVTHFARVLRAAGMPVGTDRVLLALRALECAGLDSRADLRAALSSCFVARASELSLFDQAFYLFWQDANLLGRALGATLPAPPDLESAKSLENQRLAQALYAAAAHRASTGQTHEQSLQAGGAASLQERLRQADFDTMSAAEWQQARALLARIEPFFERVATRRTRLAPHGAQLDWRASMRAQARSGTDSLCWRSARFAPAPLVILADISGSMSKYSRMLLHFAHALSRSDVPVSAFVFGTRLTSITRHLRHRDVDVAVARVVAAVADWSGGTRIHDSLREFNRHWARRVLGQNATVLLVSDGLEHGATEALGFEMERLSKSCHRLVWLNPLLRYDRFEPRAAGIRAMLPWVDQFLPVHNLASLEQLARVLAATQRPRPSMH
jgi:uncharacterized protein with von Willebrand factor type A (vWA) domain